MKLNFTMIACVAGLFVFGQACIDPPSTGFAPDTTDMMDEEDLPNDMPATPLDMSAPLDVPGDLSDAHDAHDEGMPEDVDQDSPDLTPDQGIAPHPDHTEIWCERVQTMPAPSQTSHISLQLSRAHASMRFFGVHTSYGEVDAALSESLRTWDNPDLAPDLTRYDELLSEACLLPDAQRMRTLSTTQVLLRDGVAFITPGESSPVIPADAEAIVLDWRNLPDDVELDAHLRTSLSAVLTQEFQPSAFNVRRHSGMADEVFAPGQSIYRRSVAPITPPPVAGEATEPRPIAIWVDTHVPASVAQLAGALRLQGRAALLGEPLTASMAESSAISIGENVLVHRTRDMLIADQLRWPDFIGTDAHVWTLSQVLEVWQSEGFEVTQLRGLSLRPKLERLSTPAQDTADRTLHPGVMRAGLVTSHGAFDLFFAYFDDVGRDVDVALPELLAEVDSSAPSPIRADYSKLLMRLMHHLHDAHCFLNDLGFDATSFRANSRFLPIRVAYIEERPMIDWSDEPLLQPGDELLEINGQPVSELIESWRPLVAAATSRNALLQMGSFFLYQTEATLSIRVRRVDGNEVLLDITTRTSLNQQIVDRIFGLRFPRASGWLADMGAPDVLYINLDSSLMNTTKHVTQLYDEINLASSVVLDMRGYPGTWSVFQIAGAIVGAPYSSPLFTTPLYQGTDVLTLEQTSDMYPGSPAGVAFSGRTALLVGPGTQSFAENFSMGLVTERAVEILGEQSSGTNGNITGLIAPGGFTVTFTGMDVRFSDGAPFHGRGIVPDEEVVRSVEQIASGEDSVLRRALDRLTTPP